MKANDFIKKFGIEKTTDICGRYFDYTHVTNDARMFIDEIAYKKYAPHFADGLRDAVKIEDLKRLVESHDVVNRYESDYGESAQWFFVADYCKKHQLSPFIHSNYNEAVLVYNKFVEDVESCQ